MKKLGYLILNKISYPMIEYKDGWVAVDENSSNIKSGDWITDGKEVYKAPDIDGFIGLYKIIAQSPNLPLEGVMKVEMPPTWDMVTKERLLNAVDKSLQWSDGEISGLDAIQLEQRFTGILAAQQRSMFTEEQLEACWLAATRKTVEPLTQPGYSMFMDSLLPKYEVEMENINRNLVDCIGGELGTGCIIRDGCNCKSSPVKLEPVTFEKNGDTIVKAKLI